MATARRRTRTDTVAGQIGQFQAATIEHSWPEIVARNPDRSQREIEMALFQATLKERSFADWTDLTLVMAARASSMAAFVMHEQALVLQEGAVVSCPRKGIDVTNPRLSGIQMASSALTGMLRALGLSTPVTDRRALANSARAAREAAAVIQRSQMDDLLA